MTRLVFSIQNKSAENYKGHEFVFERRKKVKKKNF